MTSLSEKQINGRRNWKAEAFEYDHYIPDGSKECQYCLTEKQAEILRGIVVSLGWGTRWWSNVDTVVSLDEIQAFRDDIVRRLMMSCCGDELPIQYQYTPDGTLQQSTDGGVTFEDAPNYDPRVYSPTFPPMAGSDGDDKRCLAATGAVDLIKAQIGDQLTDDMSRYTLGQLISDWVGSMLNSANVLDALITVVTNQLFALVIATLRPALTDTVYDTLKCILYCRIAGNATVNNRQWGNIRSDITAQIGGIAGVFLEHLIYLLGTKGTTNLLRAGGATEGDCSDCDACPSDCTGDGWWGQIWFGDHWAEQGETLEVGDNYIILKSFDRGDGVQTFGLSVKDRVTCCSATVEWISDEPAAFQRYYNICPNPANYFTLTPEATGGFCRSMTSFQALMTAGQQYTAKFTFVDECP